MNTPAMTTAPTTFCSSVGGLAAGPPRVWKRPENRGSLYMSRSCRAARTIRTACGSVSPRRKKDSTPAKACMDCLHILAQAGRPCRAPRSRAPL